MSILTIARYYASDPFGYAPPSIAYSRSAFSPIGYGYGGGYGRRYPYYGGYGMGMGGMGLGMPMMAGLGGGMLLGGMLGGF